MDEFKRENVKLATSLDYNAYCVHLGDRPKTAKILRRYSRRKMKENLREVYRDCVISS